MMVNFPKVYEKSVCSVFIISNSKGLGTGFIIRSDGLIITNKHVVGKQKVLHIETSNGYSFNGEVIKSDHNRDLVALKPTSKNSINKTPYLRLGDSKKLKVGQEVIAIGHPDQSSSFSFSQGFISAISYNLDNIDTFLQLNISVNWGNSGGPVISEDGKVIGVITQSHYTSNGERIEGVSYAIPLDDLTSFVHSVPDLREGISGLQNCSICGNLVKKSTYCTHCGTRFNNEDNSDDVDNSLKQNYRISIGKNVCKVCAMKNKIEEKYCIKCGSYL